MYFIQKRKKLKSKKNSNKKPHSCKEQRDQHEGKSNQKELSPVNAGAEQGQRQKRGEKIYHAHDHYAEKNRERLCPVNRFSGMGFCKQIFRGSLRALLGVNGDTEVHPENTGRNHKKAGKKRINAQR